MRNVDFKRCLNHANPRGGFRPLAYIFISFTSVTNSPRTHFAFFQLLPVEPFFEFRASALNAHAILKLWAALDIQLQSKDC